MSGASALVDRQAMRGGPRAESSQNAATAARLCRPSTNGACAPRLCPARPVHVPEIECLLEPFARRGLLLQRPRGRLYRHVREFMVALDGTAVVGCAALQVYSAACGEVGAVAVDERLHGRGIGRRLVVASLANARELELDRVYALTRQTCFFGRLGFVAVPMSEFTDAAGNGRVPELIDTECKSAMSIKL